MAKHAKPTYVSSLMRTGVRGTAALAVTAAGLLAAGPIASAGEAPHPNDDDDVEYVEANDTDIEKEDSDSQGLVNVSDNNAQVPIQACNNYVPVNVLGVQVPLEDIAGTIPIVAEDTDTETDQSEHCGQASGQEN